MTSATPPLQPLVERLRPKTLGEVIGQQYLLLESFKGPAMGSEIDVQPDAGKCGAPGFMVGDEGLVLAFDASATACDKHPPEHFLLQEFRLNAAKLN